MYCLPMRVTLAASSMVIPADSRLSLRDRPTDCPRSGEPDSDKKALTLTYRYIPWTSGQSRNPEQSGALPGKKLLPPDYYSPSYMPFRGNNGQIGRASCRGRGQT